MGSEEDSLGLKCKIITVNSSEKFLREGINIDLGEDKNRDAEAILISAIAISLVILLIYVAKAI